MHRYFVYLITNKLNFKIYVGLTEGPEETAIRDRFKDHIWSRNKQDHFHAAIRLYGEDAFVVQELGRYQTLKEMNNAESLWILTLRSFDPKIGYNTTFGGGYRGKPTEETKAKIGLASSQRTHTEDTKEKMRQAHLKRDKSHLEHPGVGLYKGRFRVRIKIHGKETCLGIFDTLEEASQTRVEDLKKIEEIGFEAFEPELMARKKAVNEKRMAIRPHRGPLSDEEKEQISIRTKKRWAKNFNWTETQFASPFVEPQLTAGIEVTA